MDNFIVQSEKISGDLDGFKIVQISDLHNAYFGRDNDKLLTLIKNQNPDIVVITGDLVDSNHTNINRALEFAQRVQETCPTYYVTGNHEYWLDEKDLVMSGHAHGGQFRLPFIGGVVAPDQGFNPQYTEGEYKMKDTTMIVSRGLGNSIIPVKL